MTQNPPTPEQLENFGRHVFTEISTRAFGSISKNELELTYLSALVRSEIIDLDHLSNFELARKLLCTPSKASNLRFNYQIRVTENLDAATLRNALAKHTVIVEVTAPIEKKGKKSEVILNVENKFWQDVLISEFKKAGIYSDTSFNRERVIVDTRVFLENAHTVFGLSRESIEGLLDEDGEHEPRVELFQSALAKFTGGAIEGVGSTVTVAALKFLGQLLTGQS